MWDYAEVLRVRCLQDDTKPQELGLMHQAGRGDPFTYAALILDEGEVVFEAEVRQSTRSAGMQKKLLPVGELTAKWVKKHAKIENPFDESEDEREDAPEPATLTGVAAYRKIIQNPDRWFDLIERPLLKPPSDPKNCKTQLIETVKGIKFTLQGNIVDGRKHAAFLVWPTHGSSSTGAVRWSNAGSSWIAPRSRKRRQCSPAKKDHCRKSLRQRGRHRKHARTFGRRKMVICPRFWFRNLAGLLTLRIWCGLAGSTPARSCLSSGLYGKLNTMELLSNANNSTTRTSSHRSDSTKGST
jgi:hypothetical protein